MAEAALLTLTGTILSKIAAPALKEAFLSIWKSSQDLEELKRIVQTIQASLRDAEDQAEASARLRDWIERTKEVLYNVDDLFDEIAANDLLKQQKEKDVLHKVLDPVTNLISAISKFYLAKRVKHIRKELGIIREDMGPVDFKTNKYEKSNSSLSKRLDSGWHVDPKQVFGRKEAKETIRGFLKSDDDYVQIIAIVGMSGMGKTTLAQLVYSDADIKRRFGRRWWAWISKTCNAFEVTGKIFQSMTGDPYKGLSVGQLQTGIRECVSVDPAFASIDDENERFLLVLDDLWEEDHAKVMTLMSLLSRDSAEGSKILVTTRSPIVANSMLAYKAYDMKGLSWEASWDLFKIIAFTPERANDQEFNKLGEVIVKKCANVPLAIKSIASLLYTKPTLEDWSCIEQKDLSKIELTDDSIISALKLSYDHLPSHLKLCFAYCYLFPKDHIFLKKELVYLWIAQGYVKQDGRKTIEAVGDNYFMELIQRCFFVEAKQDKHLGEIVSCKMHSLMHDLAQRVAGDECCVLSQIETESSLNKTRHFSVCYKIDSSWDIPTPLLQCVGLRSSLFKYKGSLSSVLLDKLQVKFKFLRALNLGCLDIDRISSSIGDLKHVRYLNLSFNKFTNLPDSMTKLVNLHTLDIRSCEQLKALPTKFRKLTNLVHLDNRECKRLRHMPPQFRELESLRCLTYFKVGKALSGGKCSWLDEFATMELTGELTIRFDDDMKDWDAKKYWRLPSTIRVLAIENYPDIRMPDWGQPKEDTTDSLPHLGQPEEDTTASLQHRSQPKVSTVSLLSKLQVSNTSAIQILPSFKLLPKLKALELSGLERLEYVEGEERVDIAVLESPTISLPNLEELKLSHLPKLVAWSREVEEAANNNNSAIQYPLFNFPHPPHQMPSLPRLLDLKIEVCEKLKSIPSSPCLEKLYLEMIDKHLMPQLLSSTTPKSVVIWRCNWLDEFPGGALHSLRFLELKYCKELLRLKLAPQQLNVLEEMVLQSCPKLVLWGEERGVIWDSLPNLRVLSLDEIPTEESLPSCLQDLQSLRQLEIKKPM